jgi:hypothetical protein
MKEQKNTLGQTLEFVANLTGFCGSLWLIYYGLVTRSLWVVIGILVGLTGAFNLGLLDLLGEYLERRKKQARRRELG